jgi:hypothetical protein
LEATANSTFPVPSLLGCTEEVSYYEWCIDVPFKKKKDGKIISVLEKMKWRNQGHGTKREMLFQEKIFRSWFPLHSISLDDAKSGQ